MTLKLRNGQITIENGGVPASTAGIPIYFDHELGTNHYYTRLIINDQVYEGKALEVPLDINSDEVPITVELFDTHNKIMKTYTGTFKYLKLCVLGDSNLFDIYTELQRLYDENKRLKEKGEVI